MKKICTNCKQNKLLTDFYKRNNVPDGRCSECKVCSKQRNKQNFRNYYIKNKEKILEKNNKYNTTYRENYKPRRNALKKNKYHNDICFKLTERLRSRMSLAIVRNQKSGSAISDLGCSIIDFKNYIESKFQPGMTWDNHGEWHLDHIKPLVSFDLSVREEFLKAAHFTNYQPLWAIDNLKKGSSLGMI